jgi:hypothetical protein
MVLDKESTERQAIVDEYRVGVLRIQALKRDDTERFAEKLLEKHSPCTRQKMVKAEIVVEGLKRNLSAARVAVESLRNAAAAADATTHEANRKRRPSKYERVMRRSIQFSNAIKMRRDLTELEARERLLLAEEQISRRSDILKQHIRGLNLTKNIVSLRHC